MTYNLDRLREHQVFPREFVAGLCINLNPFQNQLLEKLPALVVILL